MRRGRAARARRDGPGGSAVVAGQPLPGLVRRFVRERVQRALVVENGMLLGIVTPSDVLGAIDEAETKDRSHTEDAEVTEFSSATSVSSV